MSDEVTVQHRGLSAKHVFDIITAAESAKVGRGGRLAMYKAVHVLIMALTASTCEEEGESIVSALQNMGLNEIAAEVAVVVASDEAEAKAKAKKAEAPKPKKGEGRKQAKKKDS